MRKPLQKRRKTPAPQIRHHRTKGHEVLYAGRKTSFKVWYERKNAAIKRGADPEEYDKSHYYGHYVPSVFGSAGQLVFMMSQPKDPTKPSVLHCVDLFVSPESRGKGTATRLYQKIERIARKRNVDIIETELVGSIEHQERILTRLGWEFKEESNARDKTRIWIKKLKE